VDPGSVGPVEPYEDPDLKSGSGTGSGKAKMTPQIKENMKKCQVLKKGMFSLDGLRLHLKPGSVSWSPEKKYKAYFDQKHYFQKQN
jgi:hypothetical protein